MDVEDGEPGPSRAGPRSEPVRRISSLPAPADVARAAKSIMLRAANRAVAERGRFVVALSGGSTPLPLFRLLADDATEAGIPWKSFHLCWADERVVPYDDPKSNYGTARRVMLETLPVPTEQIHPIPVEGDPAEASRDYAQLLVDLAKRSGDSATIFDLVLLGLGPDGHTASIFPGSPAHRLALDADVSTLVVPAAAPSSPTSRVTLTAACLGRAREILFLVTGAEKRHAVRRVVDGTSDPPPPAALIDSTTGTVSWLLDAAATPTGLRPATHP